MILVISHPNDLHAGRVLELLEKRGEPALLLDLSELPAQAHLSLRYGGDGVKMDYFSRQSGAFDLCRVKSVWWRRPQAPDMSAIGDIDARTFTHNEWAECINGLWQLMEARWMNPPVLDEVAGRKALQLKVAASVGLRVPQTLVTSDPEAARTFIEQQGVGRTIYKTFSCTHEVWRETRLVGQAELKLLEHVRQAPVIFQEFIRGTDLRVTIVGGRMFPASIDARKTNYPVDFRMALGQSEVAAAELPPEVTGKLTALMKRLGLVYGAVDLRRTADGEYVFLEVNTAGEFLFIEERTGQPITQAMADWLAGSNSYLT